VFSTKSTLHKLEKRETSQAFHNQFYQNLPYGKFEKVPPYLMGANLQIGCMEFLRLLCKAKVIKQIRIREQ
jgi:hypothetical protein